MASKPDLNVEASLLYFSQLQELYIEALRKAENLRLEMDRVLLAIDSYENYELFGEATK